MDTKFTCALCSGVFDTNAEQRRHMQSPWHIWNLKRRIASLPPLPQHIFEEQVVSAHAGASGVTEDQDSPERPEKGDILGSDESTEVEFESDESDSEEEDSESDFDPHICLFCPVLSSTLDTNLQHMQKAHGLFIPDAESRLDVHALLVYLSSLIVFLHECLYCGIQKSSEEGAKAHMLDKGHCKLSEEEMRHLHEFYVAGDNEEVGDNNGSEEKSKDVVIGLGEDVDGHLAAAIEAIEDLRLPSGKTLGHRSRLRYFHRQHRAKALTDSALVPLEGTPENPEGENKGKGVIKAAKARYNSHQLTVQANTEKGLIGVPEDRKRALRAAEKKILKAEGRRRNEFRAGLEKQENKQKHFRNDVPGPHLG